MRIQSLKGTRDFYPEEKRVQNYIFNTWKEVAEKYGYSEIDGPILEPVELFAKSGEEVPEQMYILTDKSDRRLAIRPELTPTIARMVAQKQKEMQKPIKWYAISRCWRYEAPQQGRAREFFQFNIDVLGTDNMIADAEIIMTAIRIMRTFKLTKKDFFVRISNRKLLQSLLLSLEIKKEKFQDIYRLIDKIDKMNKNDFKLALKDKGLSSKQVDDTLKILSIKELKEIEKYELDKNGEEGLKELKELFSYLKTYKADGFCRLDLSIMRGFDYYTSTVFEVFDAEKEFRAIAGGGRYDNLVDMFEGEKCAGVGYGMGDVVLELFLRKKKKIPALFKELDYYVAPVNEKVRKEAIKIAENLRESYNVETDLTGRSLRSQLDYANSIKAKNVVIVGEKDLKDKQVTLKDMKSGKERKVKLNEI